jgi:PAS domain S-box-containing protein
MCRCAAVHCILAVSIVAAAAGRASAEQLPIKTYNTEAGLAHNRVKRVVQDSRGFLWFCTADGLSRFDGYQFTNYRFEDGLPAPSINDLVEASDGVYWVATNSVGVVHFDLAATPPEKADLRSRFTVYPISAEPVTNRVNVLYRDRAGALWAGTDGGLFRLNAGEKAFRPVSLAIPFHPDIQVQVWALAEDATGHVWVGTRYGVVRQMPDGRMTHYSIHPAGGDDHVSALLFDRDGRLWIGHRSGLIVLPPGWRRLIDATTQESRSLPSGTRRYTTRDGLDNNDVVAVHQKGDGPMWIRTFGSGLSRFDGETFRTYRVGLQAGDDVTSVTEDRDGNLWMGSNTGGALKIATRPWTTYGDADGLGRTVSSVLESSDGALYATSSGWRVSRFDGSSFATIRLPLPPGVNDESWRAVSGALRDHLGEWWIGTREGLFRFPRVDRFETLAETRPKAVYAKRDGLASDDVSRLFEDTNSDIWIASFPPMPEVLVRWERATTTFHRYGERDGLRPFTSVLAFAADAAGNVWTGFREGGLARYRNGRFSVLGADDGLPAGSVNGLYLDVAHRLWIAVSGGGLCRIDRPEADRPKVVRYSAADGLTTDIVGHVTGDSDGRIYVTGPRGIDRLDPGTGRITRYSTADNPAGGEFTAAFRDRAGALWFGRTTGLSRLAPGGDQKVLAPPILISGLRVAGMVHNVSALGQATVRRLELDRDQNNVQIDFFGMSFRPGEVLRYQYRLEGGTGDWSPPGPDRSVNFANLAPGSYRFAVRAVGTDGTPSPSPATVPFTIRPPLWRRSWFIASFAALSTLVAATIARSRLERLRALSESENRFRALAETASDAIITTDEGGRIVLVNHAAEHIFGYSTQQMIGATITMLVPSLGESGQVEWPPLEAERAIASDAIELPGRRSDGQDVPLEISFGAFVRNGRRFITGIARDISERRRAEEALRRSREERLAELERVRKRIATDLHDDIGSSLTRISLLSEVVRHRIHDVDPSLADPLSSIAALSRELVDSMSDIVWAINPKKDQLRDLAQRMRQFVSDVCTARQIDFRFETPPSEVDLAVGANIRREVFLMFKEAVTNMARHSGCSRADLEFRETERGLLLKITDDGRGFDVAGMSAGHGLRSMRQRTEGLGGEFRLRSEPRRGTTLTFTIPLPEGRKTTIEPKREPPDPHDYAVTPAPGRG